MKRINGVWMVLLIASIFLSGCASMNKTQKGAVIGASGGGVIGGVIGKATGNTAAGAVIGATIGGAAGAVIGKKMDKQAKEIEASVPDAKVERVEEGIIVEFDNSILFQVGKSNLSAPAKENLDKLVTILNTYPDTNIEIQGHTDNSGSESFNQKLSEKRAMEVSTYLAEKQIVNNRIATKGFGELSPKYDNTTKDGQAQNRRVEFIITANEKMKTDAEKEAAQPK